MRCSIAPNTLMPSVPFISMRIVSPNFMNSVFGAPNSIVSIAEYKDWATFAKARTQRSADPEYQKWYKDLIASDVSNLVSINLLEEVTP